MARPVRIRLAGTVLAILASTLPAAATSQELNSQVDLGDLFSSQSLHVESQEPSAGATSAAPQGQPFIGGLVSQTSSQTSAQTPSTPLLSPPGSGAVSASGDSSTMIGCPCAGGVSASVNQSNANPVHATAGAAGPGAQSVGTSLIVQNR